MSDYISISNVPNNSLFTIRGNRTEVLFKHKERYISLKSNKIYDIIHDAENQLQCNIISDFSFAAKYNKSITFISDIKNVLIKKFGV
jgi:hypothetical protein